MGRGNMRVFRFVKSKTVSLPFIEGKLSVKVVSLIRKKSRPVRIGLVFIEIAGGELNDLTPFFPESLCGGDG